jgi:hypothetical protein
LLLFKRKFEVFVELLLLKIYKDFEVGQMRKGLKKISIFLISTVMFSVSLPGNILKAANISTSTNLVAATNTGWKNIDGKWYYYTSNGVPAKEWLQVSNKWYYFDEKGVMQTGWKAINGKWYYLDSSGYMKTGWVQSGGKWYYLNNDGTMKTGWLQIGGKWYFLDSSGVMKTGWLQLGSKWYYLYSDGTMAVNTLINGYSLGSSGEWNVSTPIEKGFGNTSGNLDNDGLIVQKGSWYYYVDSCNAGIFKKDDSGKAPVKLSESGNRISVLGNWIYYKDIDKLYKMNLDGTNKTLLTSGYVGKAIPTADYIYYAGSSGSDSGIFRINHDGTGKTRIVSSSITNFTIDNGYIYYANYTGLYKIKTNGLENTQLSSDVITRSMNIENGYLYYCINKPGTYENYIYKIKLDGSGRTKINTKSVFNINVKNGWIYYSNEDELEPGLHRIKVDGTEDQFMMYGGYLAVNISGDWVYVIDRGNSAYTLTRIKLDGTIVENFQD